MVRARRNRVTGLPFWRLETGRHKVIGKIGAEVVALGVVGNFLHKGNRKAFG